MSPLVGSEWLSRRFIYPLAGISDMSRFMSAAIRRMFGFPFPGQPGYHRRSSWPQPWRSHLPPRSRVYFSNRLRRPMTARCCSKRRCGGSSRGTTRRSFAGRYFMGAILRSCSALADMNSAGPGPSIIQHQPYTHLSRGCGWYFGTASRRFTGNRDPMAVGRAKSPTVFLSGGLDDLPDQSTADGEGDCLRADISKPKGFHSVEETGPLMARRFYRSSSRRLPETRQVQCPVVISISLAVASLRSF